jgi:hypothetical protein
MSVIFSPLAENDLELLCQWLNRPHVMQWWGGTPIVDANKLVDGVKDKSRLDGIIADANKILSKDDEKLLQTDQGVVIGKLEQGGKDWSTTPLKPLDCESEHGNFQLIDRANEKQMLHMLDKSKVKGQ